MKKYDVVAVLAVVIGVAVAMVAGAFWWFVMSVVFRAIMPQ